jgi:AraC-like DNA-binding protein
MTLWNEIYFSPYSLERFPVLIFSIFVALYLLLHPARSIQSTTAGLYFVFSALFHLGFFFAHSVVHPVGAYGYYLTALSPLGVAILIQFAYYFPRDNLSGERRIVLWITGALSIFSFLDYCYFAYNSGVGVFTAGFGSFYISKSVPILIIGFYLWSISILIRKTLFHSKTYHANSSTSLNYLIYPGGKEALSCRNFALLNLFELLNTSLLTSGLLFRSLPYVKLLNIMNITFFIINTIYIVLFLRYLIGSIPITFKMIHFSLLSSLILCTLAGNIQTIFADKNFHSLRMLQINLISSQLNPQNLEGVGDVQENIELILYLKRDNTNKILYQKSDLNIPQTLNLWKQYPGLIEYIEKPKYINFADLKNQLKEEFYLRISEKNIQFYPVLHNGELYGIGFNFLEYRKYIHPQIKILFILYIFILFINFLFLPLYLAKNFIEPFEEIVSGLYSNSEILLLPSKNKKPKDEIEILRDAIFHIQENINKKEIYDGVEKVEEEDEETQSKEFILKENTIQKIKIVEKYLRENFTYELSREGLASMVNLSPGRLGKYFKMSTGIKISEYTNRLRIEKAKLLLSGTQKTVLEIAYEVGYESLRTFNRVFFAEVGMNPGQFRLKK